MKWMEHVAYMEGSRNVYGVLVGKPERKDNLEDPNVYERIILKCILKKSVVKALTDLVWLRVGKSDGLL
jgi:hypothetical protein